MRSPLVRYVVPAVSIFLAFVGFGLFNVRVQGDEASAKLFTSKCVACHAADGSGTTPAGKALKLKDLRDPGIQKMTDAELIVIIAKGKEKMPGYEKTIKPDQIQGLVAYIRELAVKK